MDKKYLHHLWTKRIKPIRVSVLIIALLISGTISVMALRNNNTQMIKLRDAVYAADEKNGDVEKALYNLRAYVHAHMNTNLATGENPVYPPIQLKYTYQRLVEAEQKRVGEASARIYTEAQADCERRFPDGFSGGTRIPCIQQYVSDHGVKTQKIPDSMYKFNFVSPSWSPDLAGWSLVVSVGLVIVLVVRLSLAYVVKNWL